MSRTARLVVMLAVAAVLVGVLAWLGGGFAYLGRFAV